MRGGRKEGRKGRERGERGAGEGRVSDLCRPETSDDSSSRADPTIVYFYPFAWKINQEKGRIVDEKRREWEIL